ncbi:unnamed protein product [Larinioides sclopetarius]|uniref:Uncharacterized protein n=1 Tax=Larinioides sclopetarius TaxID=280406 RepID=A0AAV2BD51_9ARAC
MDLNRHFPFTAFRTKQNVSKSKLGGEFAKKGWNDFSTGFSENASSHVQHITFTKGEESIKKKHKIDPEVFKKQILTEGRKTAKRKLIIEYKEADFFTSKAKDLCSLIQKKSLQSENRKDPNTHNFKRCPNSVFLEVQNIQDSFQQTKLTHQPKFHVKSSSEFSQNFITDLVAKKASGQENVPKKNGVSACQFISGENDFTHSISIKKVQKTNVFSDLYSSLAKRNSTVNNNLSELITNSEVSPSHIKKNCDKIKSCDDVKLQIRSGKVFFTSQNNNASFNLTALLGDESSKNKGSSWLQSLQTSGTEVPQEDTVGRKRIRNILPGGFAEQMLKLQRIEKSEEVIWDHNVDSSRRKAGKSFPLMLTSVSSTADLVIAKCLSLQTESPESCTEKADPCEEDSFVEQSNEVSSQSRASKSVVVLLKKAVFNKLHLKVRSIFHLYPPWQTLHLPLISHPVILCAKFIDFDLGEREAMQDKMSYNHPSLLSVSSSSTSTSNQASSCFSDIFYQWEQPMSLSGRIQRIWKVEATNKNIFPITSIPNHSRYSLLIQEQNGTFCELALSSTQFLPHSWKEFMSQAEGKCYKFHNLHVIRRFSLKKHPQLTRVLDSLSRYQDDGKGLKQEFYYQLAFPGGSDIPEAVDDEGFPAYRAVSIQPLANLFQETNIQRFTCMGKIIFQFKKTLYLCDDSVPKYMQLKSLFPVASNSSVGSLVLIRDAQFLEGCLFLDNYSSFIQVSEESQINERLKKLCEDRFYRLADINLQGVIPSINVASENSIFVFVTGEVVSVDENNALSWLQCNLCFSENLVQDSNLVIYCENCLQVVPKPVLNVKMSVICKCSPHVKAEVELLSRTTKRILQINEDTHQPQCSVGDVLGKHIGPLFCSIKSSTTVDGVKHFHTLEVDTS